MHTSVEVKVPKIEEIVNGLGHFELQVFVNLVVLPSLLVL